MRSTISTKLICVILASIFVVFVHAAVRGVAPNEQRLYQGSTFTCKDGSNSISYDKVNDEYCDCKDGSDEPGTSACPNSKFYCENEGYKSEYVFSSRVNDGVCDCCDGTDEWRSQKCPNTCDVVGREWRIQQEKQARSREEGLIYRKAYASEGQAAESKWKRELETKRQEVEVLKLLLEQRRTDKEAAETQETEERNTLRAQYEAEAETESVADVPVETPAKAEADEAQASGEGGEVQEVPTPTVQPTAEEKAEERRREIDRKVAQHYSEVSWFGRIWRYVSSFFVSSPSSPSSSSSLSHQAANQARDKLKEAESDFNSAENAIKDLEKKLATDYGSDMEFYSLDGKTFTLKTHEYEYELAPFNEVRQKQSNGVSTLLGKWGRWESNHSVMKFENGLRCWGGPDRSATIHLSCGSANELLSAEEPSKCEYVFKFTTPAACVPESHNIHHSERLAAERMGGNTPLIE